MWPSETLSISHNPETNTTRPVDWTQVYEAIRWIQLIMALFSILGSGSIIFLIIPRLRLTPELQPLFQLSLADLVLAACWLIGAILYSQRCNHLSTLCYNLHTVEQVTHLQHNHLWTPTITHRFGDCCFGVLGESF
ncbi:hypothetical protein XENOCAPTIV_007644 [Xenoophorus captivus]|uniref:Uncharacterized protein n=1 Tax=Xenoophorus captivus TaxID=1517983 RepID=A0ABV0S6J1_9TELE